MIAASAKPARSRPRWLRFRVGYLAILAAVLIFTVKFTEQTWQDYQQGRNLAAVQAQLSDERRNNSLLAWQIREYRRLGFIYQEARSWGYVNPGDRPVIVSYDYLRPSVPRTPRSDASPSMPNWQRWWGAFFGGSGR